MEKQWGMGEKDRQKEVYFKELAYVIVESVLMH